MPGTDCTGHGAAVPRGLRVHQLRTGVAGQFDAAGATTSQYRQAFWCSARAESALDDSEVCVGVYGQCAREVERADDARIAAEATATAAAAGQYAELSGLFCTVDRCPVIVGNTLVFRDDNHVTIEYAQALAPVLAERVEQALSRSG